MSHITQVETVYTNMDDIQAAAERLGGVLVRDHRSFRAYYATENKCDSAIQFPGAHYEVGVRMQPDGTVRLAWDSWDTGGLSPIMGDSKGGLFTQAYALEAAKRAGRLKRYACRETVRPDGAVELEMIAR